MNRLMLLQSACDGRTWIIVEGEGNFALYEADKMGEFEYRLHDPRDRSSALRSVEIAARNLQLAHERELEEVAK